MAGSADIGTDPRRDPIEESDQDFAEQFANDFNRMKPYREVHDENLDHFTGPKYGNKNGTGFRVPLNYIQLAVRIYTRLITAKNPDWLVTTPHRALKPLASKLRQADRYLMQRLKFNKAVGRCVQNAMFSVGFMKVGIRQPSESMLGQIPFPGGEIFNTPFGIHDAAMDMDAECPEELSYMANRYVVPLEYAIQLPWLDGKSKRRLERLAGRSKAEVNEGRPAQEETDGSSTNISFMDWVALWDCWFPYQNRMKTFVEESAAETGADLFIHPTPLVDRPWRGPDRGPFKMLSFIDVPGRLMPVPVVSWMEDLHIAINDAYNKLTTQGLNEKTVTAFPMAAAADAVRLQSAPDGHGIRVDNAQLIKQLKMGGVSQPLMAYVLHATQSFSDLGGNIESLGGLAPQADTLGQDQMIRGASAAQISEMNDKTEEFTQDIMRDNNLYLMTDPLIDLPLTKRVFGIDIPTRLTSEEMDGHFLDMNFNIEPYSMQNLPPGMRVKAITDVMALMQPYQQLMMQRGTIPDPVEAARLVGRYLGIEDELSDIFTSLEPMTDQEPTGPLPEKFGGKPAETTRNYVRTSRTSATTRGKRSAMMSTMLGGGGVQPSEREAIGRPTA